MSKTKQTYEYDLSKPEMCQKHAYRTLGVAKRTFQKLEKNGEIRRLENRTGAWYRTEDVLKLKDNLPVRGRG